MTKRRSGKFRFLIGVDFQRRHVLKIQAIIYFLSIFLLSALNIWISNMGRLQQVQAAERYGSWQYGLIGASPEDMEFVRQNQLLQSAGEAAVYGEICREDGFGLGGIGTMEESLGKLCGIRFMSGGFPEAKNEIALEQGLLEQLGLPYAIGAEFSFQVKSAEAGTGEQGSSSARNYILCGIFQSNSAYTQAGEYLPLALVSRAAAEEISQEKQAELFFRLEEGCDVIKVKEELVAALRDRDGTEEGSWIQNAFVYGSDFKRGDSRGTMLLIDLTGYALTFCLVYTYMVREKTRTGILRSLGMGESEILLLLTGEQAFIWLAALLPGLLLSGVGTRIFLENYIRRQNLDAVFLYPRESVSIACITASLVMLGGSLLGYLRARFKTSHRKSLTMDYKVLEQGRVTPLRGNIKEALLKRELQVRKRAYVGFFCMQILTLTVVSFSVGWIYRHYQGYKANRNVYVCDYIVKSSSQGNSIWGESTPVEPGLLNRIRNMEGVERVETTFWQQDVEILNEEVRNGAHYQAAERYYGERGMKVGVTLFAVEAEEGIYEELATQINEGEWNQERLETGQEAVLFLPLQNFSGNDAKALSYAKYIQKKKYYDEEYPAWMEREINVGDIVEIQIGDQERAVTVGGIAYDVPMAGNISGVAASNSYSIYCGIDVFQKLTGEAGESSTCIYIEKGSLAAFQAEQLENLLSESRVNWENIRGKILPQLEYHRNSMGMGLAFLGVMGILTAFVSCLFLSKETEQVAYKNRLLWSLGMDFKEKHLYLRWYGLCIGISALLGIVGNQAAAGLFVHSAEVQRGSFDTRLNIRGTYLLLLGAEGLILAAEMFLLCRLLAKKEKFSKNVYYFVP